MAKVELFELTPAELAAEVGGEMVRDGSARLTNPASLMSAEVDSLAFLRSKVNEHQLRNCKAGALLTTPKLYREIESLIHKGCAVVLLEQPELAFYRLIVRHKPVETRPEWREVGGAKIAGNAVIGEGVELEPGAVVGPEARVGAGCRLGANSVVAAGCVLGEACQLFPGVVLGGDGFGYRKDEDAEWFRLPHLGREVLGDSVEVGSNTSIDRGVLDDTIIGAGSKLDNLVHVGHNCRFGRRVMIAASVGFSGSVTLGDSVMVGGGALFRDGITLGERCMVTGGSVVMHDFPAGAKLQGSPAVEQKQYLRVYRFLKKLERNGH